MSETKTEVKIPVGWLRLDRGVTTLPGDWFWSYFDKRWKIVCSFFTVTGNNSPIVIRRCRYAVGETVYVWKSLGDSSPLGLGTAIIARVFASDHRGVQQVGLKKTGNPRTDSILTACASNILAPVFQIATVSGPVPQVWNERDVAQFGNDPNEGTQTETVVEALKQAELTEAPQPVEPSGNPGQLEEVSVVKQSLTTAEAPQLDHIADANKMVGNSSETPNGSAPGPKPKTLYIAGPMRGIAYFNYPMFDRIAGLLREQGLHVISPADEDRKQDGFDPFENPEYANPDRCVFPSDLDFKKTVRRCLDAVLQCEEIVLLPGWQRSSGAVAELTLAMWLGKRVRHVQIDEDNQVSLVCFWKSLESLAVGLYNEYLSEADEPGDLVGIDDDEEADDILEEALNITRGSRNASYGPPDQDFRRTAGMWSALFAAKLREGETFEPRDVALAMILLKTSRETHQRKRDNWVDIAGYARCGSLCN